MLNQGKGRDIIP